MAKSGTLTVKVLGDAKPFEDTMGKVGKTAAVAFAAVGAAGVAGAVKAVSAFTDFQGQMNEVFTLLPGISQGAMDDMSGQVKNFSKEFGVLPDKVVPALYQALSAGVPKDNVFEFLETAQMAAKGGVTELETAVDGISSVVNAYGADVVSAAQASDLMFTAVKLGKTNFEELSASLSNVTPIASGLGVKFEDVSAALASLTAKGTPTARATTQLRSLFVELSKAGGKTANTFEEMAGKTFQEFIASGGNTADALDIMKKAADESDVQLQDLFGSVEAGAAALSLASGDSFTNNIDAMGESAGATEDAFNQMMTGLGPIFDKVKAGIAVFLIDVGEKLAPYVEEAMARVGAAFAAVSDWWGKNGPAIIGEIEAVRDSIMDWIDEVRPHIESWVNDVLGNVTKWWSDHGPKITRAAERLRDGLVNAFEAMSDAVQFVVRNWDKFRWAVAGAVAVMIPHFVALGVAATASAVKQVAAWVMTSASAIGAAVAHSAQVALMVAKFAFLGVQALAHAAKVAAAWLIAMGPIGLVIAAVVAVVALIVIHFDTIKEVIGKAWEAVKTATGAVWDWIKSAVGTAVEWLTSLFMNFTGPGLLIKHWDTIKQFTKATWDKMKEIVGGAIDSVVGFISGLGGRIRDAASGAFNGIKDAFRNALNWIVDAWNRLRFPSFSIPKVSIPGLGDIGGGTIGGWDLPNIDRFDTGGIVPGRTGEPRLILAHGGETVLPTHTGRGFGMGPTTIVTQIVLNDRVVAEAVNDYNAGKARRNGRG